MLTRSPSKRSGALEGVQYYLDAGICVLPDQCHPGTGAELECQLIKKLPHGLNQPLTSTDLHS